VAEVAGTHPVNAVDDVYVALQDNKNRTAVRTYAGGANVAGWTHWEIPLTDFASVDGSAVTKMFIGVGNRNQPKAGGTGIVFFDDILVTRPAPAQP